MEELNHNSTTIEKMEDSTQTEELNHSCVTVKKMEGSTQTEELNHSCTTAKKMKSSIQTEEFNHSCTTIKKVKGSDPSRSKAKFRLTVGNLSSLNYTHQDFPPCYIRNLPWNVQVEKCTTAESVSYLGVFLQCNHGVKDPSWSVFADVKISIIPQKKEVSKFTLGFVHRFHELEYEFGYPDFVSWNDVETKYALYNCITLEVRITAELPILVSTNICNLSGGLEDQDPAQKSATFRLNVRNYLTDNKQEVSPTCYIANIPWKIIAVTSEPQKNKKRVDLFLQCNHGILNDTSWECTARVVLRIVSQNEMVPHISKEIDCTFNSKNGYWGCEPFVVWNDKTEDSKNFEKSGSIIIEVDVCVFDMLDIFWETASNPPSCLNTPHEYPKINKFLCLAYLGHCSNNNCKAGQLWRQDLQK